MPSTRLKTFTHPAGVYHLEYPADWEHLEKDDARSCGFGPKDRDDVGLWISILPAHVDTDQLAKHLPEMMQQSLGSSEAGEVRPDPTIAHHALRAEMLAEGQGGYYWIVAGGDVVLFASSQVPRGERDVWNPAFDALMASLRITREVELLLRRAATEVVEGLRRHYPDEEFQVDDREIRWQGRVAYLSNLYREVRAAPKRRKEIVRDFVAGLVRTGELPLGREVWDEVRGQILPVLKPCEYIKPDSPTRHLLTAEWLADVLICYVIKDEKLYRFVTGWDADRWGVTAEALHQVAMDNLAALPWPSRMEGARQRDGGRVILVTTNEGLASSRLLHPDFHRMFSGPLGNPFWAGIPDRSTLVAYSDRRALKRRMERQLRKDFKSSAYPICPRPFLVTADGIAPGSDS